MGFKAKYKEHLEKVCKDELLRQYALDFFEDLSSYYAGNEFTVNDFSSLIIDGQVVEQDVVRDLFKNREKVPAEEIFSYLFIKNIDKFALVKRVPNNPNVDGEVDSLNKTCSIMRKNPSVNKVIGGANGVRIGFFVKRKEMRRRRKEAKEALKSHYKKIVYHELSHVFELETYNDRQVIRIEMSNKSFMKTKNGYSLFFGNDTRQGVLDIVRRPEEYGVTAENFIELTKSSGANAISEILNEIHGVSLVGPIEPTSGFRISDRDRKYLRRTRLDENACVYNRDFDIASLVRIVLGDKKVRFNSEFVLYTLGRLNVSPEFLAEEKDELVAKFDGVTEEEDKQVVDMLEKSKGDLDSYDVLTITMGIMNVHYDINESMNDDLEEFKILVQGLLVESIKNDILAKLDDPMYYKGKEFYAEVNRILETIDGCICYPNTRSKFIESYNGEDFEYTEVSDFYTLPPEIYAQKNPSMKSINAFAELVSTIKARIDSGVDGLDGMDEIMTYYHRYKELKKKYDRLIDGEEFAKEMQKSSFEQLEELEERKEEIETGVDMGTRSV